MREIKKHLDLLDEGLVVEVFFKTSDRVGVS